MDFESSKNMLYMNILTYIDVLVNIRTLSAFLMHKGAFFFDSL